MHVRRKSRLKAKHINELIDAFSCKHSSIHSAKLLGLNRNTTALHYQKIREKLLKLAINESAQYLHVNHRPNMEALHLLLSNTTDSGSLAEAGPYRKYFDFHILPFQPKWLKRRFPSRKKRAIQPIKFGSNTKIISSGSVLKNPVIWYSGHSLDIQNTRELSLTLNSEFSKYIARYRGIPSSKLSYYLAEFLFFRSNPHHNQRRTILDNIQQSIDALFK